jgi:hypothetical protein
MAAGHEHDQQYRDLSDGVSDPKMRKTEIALR